MNISDAQHTTLWLILRSIIIVVCSVYVRNYYHAPASCVNWISFLSDSSIPLAVMNDYQTYFALMCSMFPEFCSNFVERPTPWNENKLIRFIDDQFLPFIGSNDENIGRTKCRPLSSPCQQRQLNVILQHTLMEGKKNNRNAMSLRMFSWARICSEASRWN